MERQQNQAGVSLLFADGLRPSALDIERLLAEPSDSGAGAAICHRPDHEAGWVELVASGLTFDLSGLAPSMASRFPEAGHQFGLANDICDDGCEAITLSPGAHIGGGAGMLPVVRVMTGIAANLALQLPARVVCWHPSRCWMEPQYFARIVVSWLSGGAFPALGLTAVERRDDGDVESAGLAFFIGQELRVEARRGEAVADTVKLAARVIDNLVRHGRVDSQIELTGPLGEALLADPSADRRLVTLRRSG